MKVIWCSLRVSAMILLMVTASLTGQTEPVEGIRSFTPRTYAFINGHIHTRPGNLIENGSMLIRDGLITETGKKISIPETATVIDLKGKHVYPGFIDGYMPVKFHISDQGSRDNWNRNVQSGENALDHYSPGKKDLDRMLSQGFTAVQIVLDEGVFAGQTAVVQLNVTATSLSASASQAAAFRHRNWDDPGYPNALLGTIALMRQTLYDALWYSDAMEKVAKYPNLNEPADYDRHLDALSKALSDGKPFLFETGDEMYAMRAGELAGEFGLKIHLAGNGYEYRRLEEIKKSNAFVFVPVNFPGKPDVSDPYRALEYSTSSLKHWDIAPDNALRMANAGIAYGLTCFRLKDVTDFKKNIIRSVQRGLSPISALAALTTNPAEALGIDNVLGKLEEGYLANFFITEKEYFDKDSDVSEVWVVGVREWENSTKTLNVSGEYALTFGSKTGVLKLKPNGKGFSGTITFDTTEVSIEKTTLDQNRLSWSATLKSGDGKTRFRAVLTGKTLTGTAVDPWGLEITWIGTRIESLEDEEEKPEEIETASDLQVVYPEGAFGVANPPVQYSRVLINDATIWTAGPQGTLDGWDILIEKGKISRIARDISLSVRPDILIEGEGKHVTPGIIDAHSHMAASSINEGSQSITSEVRIRDVINSDDMTIYRQLAGGTTASNILHGSANTIGGQNAVIKLRWGTNPQGLIYDKAPQGIKFALGENVKQSNWGDDATTRYPQTRMGVEQILRDAFTRASDYKKNLREYERNSKWRKTRVAPRRDLELDALVEVMEGKRFVHCHSYRQDEILMLTRVAEDFGWRIKTLQHILEGYKVADRMVDHGVGGSTFSDWWAYKFEVYDAIPYNAALMHDVGVVVTFNSDDGELGRRLNLEAAKGVKYGGMSEEEALKTVTLNSAIQLGIDKWTGSIEIGKDADFVVWSGHPLSTYSMCEETWVDGRQYFSLDKDRILREENERVRNELIQKILASDDMGGPPMEPDTDEDKYYSCRDHSAEIHMEGGAK